MRLFFMSKRPVNGLQAAGVWGLSLENSMKQTVC